MKIEVNAPGLTVEEIRQAIEDARERKIRYEKMPWDEMRKEILEKIIRLITLEDLNFTENVLRHIAEKQPDLLKKYMTS